MSDIKIVCGPHRELSRGSYMTTVGTAGYFAPAESRPRVWLLLGAGLDSDGAPVSITSQEGFGTPINSSRPGAALLHDEPDGELGYYVVTGDHEPAKRRYTLSCRRKRCSESWTAASEDELYAILDGLRARGIGEVSISSLRFAQNEYRAAQRRMMR